ncbi:MAG: hypothetical protein LBC41_15585, partial [Clostridiales bacterium]|nr:hypothetical protein [Clostridiales bacterium]
GFEGTVTGGAEPEWLKAGNKESLSNFYKSFFADPQGHVFEHAFESKDIGVRGVIFFRKINDGEAEIDGHIKVYCRGVYVGDNIPGLVPKLAALENGIIECESLPLLAARSGLALGDAKSEAVLISECISQELAIFFHDMFSNRRAELEAAWPDVGAFVKYGVLQDKIFSSVMARKILFMDSFGQCKTVAEHAANGGSAVYYASDMQEQAYYIDIFKQANAGCLLFDHVIDRPLLYKYETLFPKLKFSRIDSNLELVLGAEPLPEDERDAALLEEKMLALLGDRLKELKPVAKRLKSSHIAAVVTNDEESRRLADLMDIYGYLNPDDSDQKERVSKSKLLLNVSSKPARYILKAESESAAKTAATHLLDMALLGQNALKPEYVPAFIQRSVKMLELFLDDGAESES